MGLIIERIFEEFQGFKAIRVSSKEAAKNVFNKSGGKESWWNMVGESWM
jgi:hypothetical protein